MSTSQNAATNSSYAAGPTLDEYPQISYQPNFKPVDHLFQERLRQFTDTGGQYPELNLPHFYDIDRVDTNTPHLNIKVWKVPDGPNGETERPLFKEIDFDNIDWQDANKGNSFGPSWKTFWFKIEWEIPSKWLENKNLKEIHFQWDCNNEGLIYSKHGLPLQAFTGGGERTVYSIPKEHWSSKKQLYYLEMACNGMFGTGDSGHPDPNRYFRLDKCDLVLPNVDARRLYWDFWIIGDASRELSGWQKFQSNTVANEIMNVFDPNDPDSVLKGRELATKILGDKVDLEDVFDDDKRIDVYAVGNCHIDTAWLWPWAETKRKIVRSWTTQLKIADTYPEYVFVASQMQQFKWLKLYHPEILDKIKDKFTTNQFLPVGGSWVENDTNLPNGESLIRQFLLGQRFQLNEFGLKATTFWLPDTFGYSSQIPQICQSVGIGRFLTQKLSWNNINTFPLSTFNWVSLDGSQVLVHMPPADTYTASAHFGDVIRSQNNHKNLRDVPTGLLLYGHGDGGGGPTEEMVEKLRRCKGLADTVGGIPTVHVGNTVDDFYENVLERSNQGSDLPSWRGEIYLEFHRGTYTSQADIKKFNRLGEVKLHDLELIASYASIVNLNYDYPAKELVSLWQDLCLGQFHDIIPGSCIGMVYYEEAKPMYRKLLAKADKLIKEALKSFEKSDEKQFVNTLPWSRAEVIELDNVEDATLINSVKKYSDSYSYNGKTLVYVKSDSTNCEIVNTKNKEFLYPASVSQSEEGNYILSNKALTATISPNGIITSLYDEVNDREIIDTTATKQTNSEVIGGNQLVVFDDQPLQFPAWDTELYSLNKFKFLNNGEVSILTNDKLESSLLVKNKILEKSYIETVISIQGLDYEIDSFSQNNFIKFKSHVEWHETYKFLKVQFPTTINSASLALYETQFGITERPTHYNTSWDVAKFEVCHHKFLDLSGYNYGVSILNNSKYGASVHGNLIRLSLLRSPKAPDDKADMGSHDFEYAIYPHSGPLGNDTVKLAHNFNYKLDQYVDSKVDKLLHAISLLNNTSAILSHVKRAEDDEDVNVEYPNLAIQNKGQKSLVVRVYESLGGSVNEFLKIDDSILKVDKVYLTNSLEEVESEVKKEEKGYPVKLRGFGFATYKIVLK